MTPMEQAWRESKENLRRASASTKTKNRAGVMSYTDLPDTIEKLLFDLTNRQFQTAIDKMNTQIRKAAVTSLKRGSSSDSIGRSQYGKVTRGNWKNPSVTAGGVEYLKGGWYGDTLKKRGANKPSMAYNGGASTKRKTSRGDRGIISKVVPTRGGGLKGINGPRYSEDDKDNGKYGYNYAHILEKGGKNVPWGKKERATTVPARPFLGPAGDSTKSTNLTIFRDLLVKWGRGG